MKPLSSKKRSSMLYLLTLAFVVCVPVLLLYSTGYRIDDSFNIVKTGGIFLHSEISNTSVYLDDEFIEDNGVILRNTLIQDLTPNKIYKVTVQKQGFHNWAKELKVLPNLVIEANLLLWPSVVDFIEIEPTILVKEVVKESSTEAETEDEIVDEEPVETEIDNPEYLILEKFFEEELEQFEVEVSTIVPGVTKPEIEIVREYPEYIDKLSIADLDEKVSLKEKNKHLAWLESGKVFVNWIGEDDSTPFYFCNTICGDQIVVSMKEPILAYDFLPGRDDVLIVLTSKGLFVKEIDSRSTSNVYPILEKADLDFKVKDGNTILIKDGELFLEVQ